MGHVWHFWGEKNTLQTELHLDRSMEMSLSKSVGAF